MLIMEEEEMDMKEDTQIDHLVIEILVILIDMKWIKTEL